MRIRCLIALGFNSSCLVPSLASVVVWIAFAFACTSWDLWVCVCFYAVIFKADGVFIILVISG